MKRSTAVALIAAGTLGVGAYALTERRDCQRDISGNLPPGCSSSSGRGGGGGSAFYGGSSSTSTSSPGSTSTARSGFGATGAAHGAGS